MSRSRSSIACVLFVLLLRSCWISISSTRIYRRKESIVRSVSRSSAWLPPSRSRIPPEEYLVTHLLRKPFGVSTNGLFTLRRLCELQRLGWTITVSIRKRTELVCSRSASQMNVLVASSERRCWPYFVTLIHPNLGSGLALHGINTLSPLEHLILRNEATVKRWSSVATDSGERRSRGRGAGERGRQI